MNLLPIYTLPLGCVNVPQFIEPARSWFKNSERFNKADGLMTTLGQYTTSQPAPDLCGIDKEPQGQEFINQVGAAAQLFMIKMGYSPGNPVVANMWMNEMASGDAHPAHRHYGKVISACYYVDVPQGSGPIMFYTPLNDQFMAEAEVDQFTTFNSRTWSFQPSPGDLFLWQSFLTHEVLPGEFAGYRRSIASDIVF